MLKTSVSITASLASLFTVRHYLNADRLVASESNPLSEIPSRSKMIEALKTKQFDVLIIGGGATGAGCALDAATRGLNTALVERDDFSSGTSSRSTKLVHGGVRYLEKAFLDFDIEQYKLVKEALYERGVFLKIAPHLTYELATMLPIYKWWQVPYYFVGSKAYDLLAGSQGLTQSYWMFPSSAKLSFPTMKKKGLLGAMVYYDGAQNDSRMNVAIIMTAALNGAAITNHVEVLSLLKKTVGGVERVCGACVRDQLSGEVFDIKSEGVINATGPFTDAIRAMDDQRTKTIVSPSSGVHLIIPDSFCPPELGLIDPSTSDGRVIFVLPWLGSVIAGTTDSPTHVSFNPQSTDEEIDWIIREVNNLMNDDIKLTRNDILAAWTGIRPLVSDPNAKDTGCLVRNHIIDVSKSGLLTIAGGKWTTYRAMAEETVDRAIKEFNLIQWRPCTTGTKLLVGAAGWKPSSYISLVQRFGLTDYYAKHLSNSYGSNAEMLAGIEPVFLSKHQPYAEHEVLHACRNELACTAIDVLARRMRLAFLNASEAHCALPRVVELMSAELGWSKDRQAREMQEGVAFLRTMGLELNGK